MRIQSGIPGLDELIEGGFEEGSITLISGKTGTCKSIFSSQFIYNGARRCKENGLYITTGETISNIKKQSEKFGWDFGLLEKKSIVKFVELEPFDTETLMDRIMKNVESVGAKRIVVDSVSMLELYMQDPFKIRKVLYKILQRLREMNKVVLVVSEVPEESRGLSRTGVVEFMVDGVIVLQYMGMMKYSRSLVIRKMRMTRHSTDIHPFEIGPEGIEVHSI
jgi:KaiC/GvpD/RAD55 family RecA-like ATPase